MMLGRRSAALHNVLTGMAADPRIADELVREARAGSSAVARLPEAENRRHIQALLAAGLRAFAGNERTDEVFAAAEALGAERAAQGVPIAELLGGVQAAKSQVLRIAIERSRTAGVPDDVLLEVWPEVDRYTCALERHVVSGYHAASRTAPDLRAQLLLRLLQSGGAGRPDADQLRQVGLHPDGRYHCLIASPVGDGSDPARLRHLEQCLSYAGCVHARLDGRLAALAPRLPGRCPGDLLVIAAPPVALSALPEVYPLVVAAVPVAVRRGLRGLRELTEVAGETALAGQPVLAGLLCASLLGPLDRTDEFHRELALTALAYLDHGQRLGRTAASLHLHPNTIRYRLDRLAEITGIALDEANAASVPETLHRWWALHTWLADR